MDEYKPLLERFVHGSQTILGDRLVGVYLHGSAAMGCFNGRKSDIDLIVVIDQGISDEVKRRYMDMVVELNQYAPPKGLEISVLRRDVCRPFVYPTPFELHFSAAHLDWYRAAPEDYIKKMNGTDRDLAAHAGMIRHRGRVLWGEDAGEVFGAVGRTEYLDSIRTDVEHAAEEVETNPTYIILNLCRVLAYKEQGKILSKQEGGDWGLANVPERFQALIAGALSAYQAEDTAQYDQAAAKDFAAYMLTQINEA